MVGCAALSITFQYKQKETEMAWQASNSVPKPEHKLSSIIGLKGTSGNFILAKEHTCHKIFAHQSMPEGSGGCEMGLAHTAGRRSAPGETLPVRDLTGDLDMHLDGALDLDLDLPHPDGLACRGNGNVGAIYEFD